MSSGFSGGVPEFFSGGIGSTAIPMTINGGTFNTNLNPQKQFSFPSPLAGIPPDPAAQIRPPDFIGKRSLAEFHHQQNRGLGLYPRNVKQRASNYPLYAMDLSPEMSCVNPRYGLPILTQRRLQPLSFLGRNACDNVPGGAPLPNSYQTKILSQNNPSQLEKNIIMSHKLQELEKELLGDDDDDNETVSAVTDSAWSDTIQNLIGPARNPISLSPTSSSSSCSSTSASPSLPCPKQALADAAAAISDGRHDNATEILARVRQQAANPRGTSQQRLAAYMASALTSHVGSVKPEPEVHGREHAASTQMLYDASPCFKLGFMAANLAILEATAAQGHAKIHILDFDIGQGGQYVHLLHALAAKKAETPKYDGASLKITAVVDNFTASTGEVKMRIVSHALRALANKVGVPLSFYVKNIEINELTRGNLEIGDEEALAVNFAFRLYKLPDESVTTDNLRDETLRRVRGLSPDVVVLVEQEMNTNTAPMAMRVRDALEYYGLLVDSLESTFPRDSLDLVRIEEGLGRRMVNAVACDGLDRVERCEVFGKWRARMSMAGFNPIQISQLVVNSLRAKVDSGTRSNPGFCVNEELSGVGFGWMGRNLTVTSAWR